MNNNLFESRDPADGLEFTGGSQDVKETEAANATQAKPLNELQKSLTKKLAAETEYIRRPQTDKTNAETQWLLVRKLEAEAEVERLKVERLRIEAEVTRTQVEAKERRANTIQVYGSMIGKTILAIVVVYLIQTVTW